MKKIAIIIALASLALTANAQLRLDNAKTYANPKKGYYDKAKIEIDAACEEEGTKGNPEVWAYKGIIYCYLGESDKPKIKKVCPENWADIAYEAALKSKELNTEKDPNIIELNNIVFKNVAGRFLDEAMTLYNNADNDTAKLKQCIEKVEKGIKIYQSSGAANDKEIKENITLARYIGGAAARAIGEDETVVKLYKPLVRAGYDKNYVYLSLVSIYQQKKDTIEAMKVVKTYTEKQPNDQNAFLLAAKVCAWAGNAEQTKNYANTAIEKANALQDASQKGALFCSVADIFTDLSDYTTSENYLNKAVELDGNNPMIYNGFGRMKFNQGTDVQNKANDVPLTDETGLYEKLKEEANANYLDAEKYYKKSLEINNRSTAELQHRYVEAYRGLQTVYARLNKSMDELKVYEK